MKNLVLCVDGVVFVPFVLNGRGGQSVKFADWSFAIANRGSKIATTVVLVVQRIERRFPKTKVAFYHTSSAVVSTTQIASC